MKKVHGAWKVIGIILLVIMVIETAFVIWAWQTGTEMIENENECAYNICDDRYDAYFYDDYDEVCYCYIGDEIVYQEYIG